MHNYTNEELNNILKEFNILPITNEIEIEIDVPKIDITANENTWGVL